MLGWRRTHKDPFEGEWEQIFSWLQANPERSSAAPPDATNHYKSVRSNEGCGKSESICWKPLRSSGKWK